MWTSICSVFEKSTQCVISSMIKVLSFEVIPNNTEISNRVNSISQCILNWLSYDAQDSFYTWLSEINHAANHICNGLKFHFKASLPLRLEFQTIQFNYIKFHYFSNRNEK